MLHTTPSGLLIIDKPQGVTSFDAVAAVRGALHIKKVGHAGTLDPMATGTLVIAFGHATRLLNAIVAHDKTYEATIRLGLRTTTDDAEGEALVDDEARSRWQTLSAQLTDGRPERRTNGVTNCLMARPAHTHHRHQFHRRYRTSPQYVLRHQNQRPACLRLGSRRQGCGTQTPPGHHQRIHRAGYPQRIRSRGADR